MTTIVDHVRDRYRADGLLDRVRAAVDALAPEPEQLTVEQLAPMDQFHTRGLAATTDLARAAAIGPGMKVLDLGSGIGGPARLFAAKFGADVTGIDLSDSFVETAIYLSGRCGLADRTSFMVGNATAPEVEDESFDHVVLQHVAMNIADRPALYGAARRALKPGGLLATYDVVTRGGDVIYPTPWAHDADESILLTADATRDVLLSTGFEIVSWSDETETALAWFAEMQAKGPPPRSGLEVVLGPEFPAMAGNLGRNMREGRVGLVSAILRPS